MTEQINIPLDEAKELTTTIEPVVVKKEIPTGFGNITRKTWTAEVVSR